MPEAASAWVIERAGGAPGRFVLVATALLLLTQLACAPATSLAPPAWGVRPLAVYQPGGLAAPQIHAVARDGNTASANVLMAWDAPSTPDGIAGFGFAIDRAVDGLPPHHMNTSTTSSIVTLPSDGDWFFHVSAVDNAGDWSPSATMALHLDTVPLVLSHISFSAPAFNPSIDRITLTSSVGKAADVTASIIPASGGATVRSLPGQFARKQIELQWDGKDDYGKIVVPGDYRLRLRARDQAGNQAEATSQALTVTNKRIVVSLGQETLFAYEGSDLIMRSVVTTGGPDLPTQPGTFHILDKTSPLNVYSPWPKGSPYWFPDVTYRYAMLFDENAQFGLYVHDASWRTRFGPGSNVFAGTPGGDQTGTHGCINVPESVQASLFAWAPVGTPLTIQS